MREVYRKIWSRLTTKVQLEGYIPTLFGLNDRFFDAFQIASEIQGPLRKTASRNLCNSHPLSI
jgi:hypothetical protein